MTFCLRESLSKGKCLVMFRVLFSIFFAALAHKKRHFYFRLKIDESEAVLCRCCLACHRALSLRIPIHIFIRLQESLSDLRCRFRPNKWGYAHRRTPSLPIKYASVFKHCRQLWSGCLEEGQQLVVEVEKHRQPYRQVHAEYGVAGLY